MGDTKKFAERLSLISAATAGALLFSLFAVVMVIAGFIVSASCGIDQPVPNCHRPSGIPVTILSWLTLTPVLLSFVTKVSSQWVSVLFFVWYPAFGALAGTVAYKTATILRK